MTNIVQPYIDKYLQEIYPEEDPYLKRMRQVAEEDLIPIVDRQVAEFLKMLLSIEKPQKILELGTAIGYSASLMAKTLGKAHIDTVEIAADMAVMARTNLHNQNLEGRIHLYVEDAMIFMRKTKSQYDFIFIDAAKGQYEEYFIQALDCLTKEGMIVMDNVLFHGMIAKEGVELRRKVTIIKRLKKFLPKILSDTSFISNLLPIGDGLLLVRRKNEEG